MQWANTLFFKQLHTCSCKKNIAHGFNIDNFVVSKNKYKFFFEHKKKYKFVVVKKNPSILHFYTTIIVKEIDYDDNISPHHISKFVILYMILWEVLIS